MRIFLIYRYNLIFIISFNFIDIIMFCLYNNIFVCGINEIGILNINNFNYIVNCTNNNYTFILNIDSNNKNYINLDMKFFNLAVLNNFYKFFENSNNAKILLLDEDGTGIAMLIGIFVLMKFHNAKFNKIYNSLIQQTKLNEPHYYNNLVIYEAFIIQNHIPMDISY